MNTSIKDNSAIHFSKSLYSKLKDGICFDEAFGEACYEVRKSDKQFDPVLVKHQRVTDEQWKSVFGTRWRRDSSTSSGGTRHPANPYGDFRPSSSHSGSSRATSRHGRDCNIDMGSDSKEIRGAALWTLTDYLVALIRTHYILRCCFSYVNMISSQAQVHAKRTTSHEDYSSIHCSLMRSAAFSPIAYLTKSALPKLEQIGNYAGI
jgi:hypothetical protein